MKVINKIAFLVHEPTMYTHYASVWTEMEKDTFVIVLLGVFSKNSHDEHGTKEFVKKVTNQGYEITYLNDLVANKIRYQYVVSNHILGGSSRYPTLRYKVYLNKVKNIIKCSLNFFHRNIYSKNKYQVNHFDSTQYIPLQAGITQIRFMYGADISDAWSLDEWNEIYDLFLCHGPNDEMHLRERFKGKTAQMGYPRYDGYFNPDLNIDDVVSEFDIDLTKKTILWMPTYDVLGDYICSIIPFSAVLSNLTPDFNIIVRPHPLSFRHDPTAIETLKSFGYKVDRDSTRDMNKLFKLADFVFCDYGGSAFGALYLGKKMVFLSNPDFGKSLMAKGSSNLELRKYFPSVTVEEAGTLSVLLKNTSFWDETLNQSKLLSNKFFADYRGTSSLEASKILSKFTAI